MTWLLTAYMPHSHCYGADPLIFWAWVVGDVVTWLSYCALPGAILTAAWRRREDIGPREAAVIAGFGAFIVLCGFGHLLDALAQWWWPAYRLRALWGVVTASVSVWTAWMLWRLVPELSTARTGGQVAELVQAAGAAPLEASAPMVDMMAAVLAATEAGRHAARLAQRVYELPIGICEVSAEGRVEEIDGGALRLAGARREHWLGLKLESPQYVEAIEAALTGRRTTFAEMDPAQGVRPTLVTYVPARGGGGCIEGAHIAWVIGEEKQRFEVHNDG